MTSGAAVVQHHTSVHEEHPLVHLCTLVPLRWVQLAGLLRQIHHDGPALEDREIVVVMINCTTLRVRVREQT